MEMIVLPTAEQAAELVARLIAARLRSKPDLVLGLATGRTMERVYHRLVATQRKEGLDFSRCHTFNLDEYIGTREKALTPMTRQPHILFSLIRSRCPTRACA